MNRVDCVIKRDVQPHKMYSCSKHICGISFLVLKISGAVSLDFGIMSTAAVPVDSSFVNCVQQPTKP